MKDDDKNKLAQVFHFDLYGKREEKYNFLDDNSIGSIPWNELEVKEPNFFFVKKEFEGSSEYEKGFKIDELFQMNASGIKTERDHLTIQFENKILDVIKEDLLKLDENSFRLKHTPKPDGRDWKISFAKEDLKNNNGEIVNILYRPFDVRKTIYTGKSKGFMAYPRNEVMQHIINKENFVLLSSRQQSTFNFQHVLLSKYIVDMCTISLQTKETTYAFPLYRYPENNNQQSIEQSNKRTPNLNLEIVNQIASKLSLSFTNEKEMAAEGEVCFANSPEVRPEFRQTFAPIDILDYIYAVLHSPAYREKYKEFLKIDFPRAPYPTDTTTFWKLVALGGELRQIHLLECTVVEKFITQYPIDGNNLVEKIKYQDDKVFINEKQYFDNVPQIAWEFYIGGYQPAQKWLKDRKGRELNFEDISHYQKIIVALMETERIMKEIDKVITF